MVPTIGRQDKGEAGRLNNNGAMNMSKIMLALAVLAVGAFVFAGCNRAETTATQSNKEKYDRIQTDMTIKEVKDILGEPTNVKTGGAEVLGVGATGSTMTWTKGKEVITVKFVNEKVVSKDLGQVSEEEKKTP